jgi:type IV secretion system protein VirB9
MTKLTKPNRCVPVILSIFAVLLFASCKTIPLDKKPQLRKNLIETVVQEEAENIPPEDLPKIVYIEKPVYYPEKDGPPAVTGKEAVTQYQRDITRAPEYANGHIQRYTFNDGYVYEVHCQPYRTTDIELEPGEEVLETPFISEPDVWQLAAGEGIKNGQRVMHFFVKPDHQKLTTSLIIITNRRVYHMELKSFYDYYMPIVRWTYPGDQVNRKIVQVREEKAERTRETFETYSFNYKIRIGWGTKVLWIPKQIYDDGMRTYIVLDEACLHQELPALFNKKNEIVNYRVQKNVLVVDELITKMTLRLGKKKITLIKKKG